MYLYSNRVAIDDNNIDVHPILKVNYNGLFMDHLDCLEMTSFFDHALIGLT